MYLTSVDGITIDLETLNPNDEPTKLLKAVREFDSYLRANTERIPHYGERRRAGEATSTAFTESAVNQVISKRVVGFTHSTSEADTLGDQLLAA